ncbi:MAG: DUF4342 domain-containing protein [Bacillota bacterium]
MKITLEQVDEVIQRTNVNYEDAKKALQESDGDVLDAIVYLEKNEKASKTQEVKKEFSDFLKEIIDKGKVNKILVKKDNEQIMNVPIAAGIIGTVFFSTAIIAAVASAFIAGCEIYIVNDDDKTINIKEYSKEKYDNLKDKIQKK